LHECMEKISSREFVLWEQYLREELNKPNRTDHYIMQISQDIRGLFQKKRPGLHTCIIEFVWPGKKKEPKPIPKAQIEATKSKWLGLVGLRRPKE
jgi:hypothetical protein